MRQHLRTQGFQLGGVDRISDSLRTAAGYRVQVLAGRLLLGTGGLLRCGRCKRRCR